MKLNRSNVATNLVGPLAVFVLLACGATAAYADSPGYKRVGDIKVTAARPETGAVGEPDPADFTFIVNDGRILLTSPGNPDTFDLTAETNGCLRGTVVLGRYGSPHPATPPDDNVELRQICPMAPVSGDPASLSRWMDDSSKLVFTAQSSTDGKNVIVQAGQGRGEFLLGDGPAANELRKRPELLAAAFAYGYVPQGSGTSDGVVTDYDFVVAADQ